MSNNRDAVLSGGTPTAQPPRRPGQPNQENQYADLGLSLTSATLAHLEELVRQSEEMVGIEEVFHRMAREFRQTLTFPDDCPEELKNLIVRLAKAQARRDSLVQQMAPAPRLAQVTTLLPSAQPLLPGR